MTKTTYQLIDELEQEMNNLRANYPELFYKRKQPYILPHERPVLAFEELALAFRHFGHVVATELEPAVIALNEALAREQARRQAGWLKRAWGRLRGIMK